MTRLTAPLVRLFRRVCGACAAAALALPLAAAAADYVSIRGATVNVREQPTTASPAAWVLARGYPLQVQERQGGWLKVADQDGALGWVSAPLTGPVPHRIVTASSARLRAGPGTNHRALATLPRDTIVRTLRTQGDWSEVQPEQGPAGWIATRLTWGW